MKVLTYIGAVLIAVFSVVLLGCGQTEHGAEKGYTVTDDTGRQVTLRQVPQRIVSLTYGTDEIIMEAAPERVIALSKWAGDPEISFVSKEAADKVGKKVSNHLEEILALQPDLVLASAAVPEELVKTLEEMKIPVYIACSPKNYEQMKQKVLGVCAAAGELEKGKKLAAKMDSDMAALEERLKDLTPEKQKTAVAFSFSGVMGKKGELFDAMMGLAHVRNGAVAAGLSQGQVISKEQVVAIDPDIFLLPTWNYDKKQDVSGYARSVMEDPAYAGCKAVRNQRMTFVEDRYRYVASHHITEAVRAIAKAVYPERFEEET